LLDFDECDEDEGLFCQALEDDEKIVLPLAEIDNVGSPNRRLIEDYCYWFGNWQGKIGSAHIGSATAKKSGEPARRWRIVTTLTNLAIVSGFYGTVLGAALASFDGAATAAKVGAVLLGMIGGIIGARYGHLFGAMNRVRHGDWYGGFAGMIFGAMIGAMLGVMLVGFVGAFLGGLAGGIIARLLGLLAHKPPATILGVTGGAMLGVGVQSWLQGADEAFTGSWLGGTTGAIAGPVLLLAMGVVLVILDRRQ